MLHQAATLNSTMSIGEAIKRLKSYPDDAWVVVRRHEGEEKYWYHHQVGDIRYLASQSNNWPDKEDTPLKIILDLHEHTSSPTVEASQVSAEEAQLQHGVMLDGDTVLGVLESEALAGAVPGSRSLSDTVTPEGRLSSPPSVGSRSTAPSDWNAADMPVSFPAASAPATPIDSPDSPVSDSKAFEAYPRLQSPDGVPVETTFELTVGLSIEKLAANSAAIIVANAPAKNFDLLVQVIAPGFRTPAGTQRLLHVNRDDLEGNEVSFALIADDDRSGSSNQLTLEVQFSYEGEACGRAWRDITVVPTGLSSHNVPVASAGSSPISTPGANHAPDLTVSITEADENGHFIWLFTSPHPVNLFKDKQIETQLKDDNARSFAVKILKGIPMKDGTDMVGLHMRGTSREIAQAMPTQFWLVLGEVWSLVHANGSIPRLLFLSAEPYVPWELASVEDEYIDPALLDSNHAAILNTQARVGRWLPPRPRTPRGGDRPSQPPAVKVGVKQIAVVTGDYLALNGIRPLPEAEAEGDQLTNQYQAVRLTATWEDVKSLLENRVEKNGLRLSVDLMHFACHGQVDTTNPTHNGIVLNGRNMRLDPTTARGNAIGAATQPFAFMNACEVGMAGETLGSYGGLAAAFLNEGFRGFVAPLWAVNDKIAHAIALKFYQKTLVDQEPVSEALRQVRLDYDPNAPMPSSTHLAYIFYGHPDLTLER